MSRGRKGRFGGIWELYQSVASTFLHVCGSRFEEIMEGGGMSVMRY